MWKRKNKIVMKTSKGLIEFTLRKYGNMEIWKGKQGVRRDWQILHVSRKEDENIACEI